jgi:hypothetical protein
MDTQELEAILEGGTETPKIDFKGACDWNIRSLSARHGLMQYGLLPLTNALASSANPR